MEAIPVNWIHQEWFLKVKNWPLVSILKSRIWMVEALFRRRIKAFSPNITKFKKNGTHSLTWLDECSTPVQAACASFLSLQLQRHHYVTFLSPQSSLSLSHSLFRFSFLLVRAFAFTQTLLNANPFFSFLHALTIIFFISFKCMVAFFSFRCCFWWIERGAS